MHQLSCNICGKSGPHKYFEAREMMIGLKNNFQYIECSQCGCLQLTDPPSDMGSYYPPNYYSFRPKYRSGSIRKWIKNLKNEYATSGNGYWGKLLFLWRPNPVLKLLSKLTLKRDQFILDVGCGSGQLLYDLKDLGYNHVLGIDPFIEKSFVHDNGLKIEKKQLQHVEGKWDLIMFHHSFEHLPNPVATLKYTSQLLKNGGTCLIRVPVADSHAYKKYQKDWAQIDAPRHYHIFTNRGMEILAQNAGLVMVDQICDANAFQFWGSEQYLRDIPLHDQRSYAVNPSSSLFTPTQIKAFEKEAEHWNELGMGDTRAFFLKKN